MLLGLRIEIQSCGGETGSCFYFSYLSSSTKVAARVELSDIQNYGNDTGEHRPFGIDFDLFQERERRVCPFTESDRPTIHTVKLGSSLI